VETDGGTVKRAANRWRAKTLELTLAECSFLLYGIYNYESFVREICADDPMVGQRWNTERVAEKVKDMAQRFRNGFRHIFIVSDLDRKILVRAVEQNRYFANMDDDDPRLTVDQLKAAEVVRQKVAEATGWPVKRILTAAGRRRLSPAQEPPDVSGTSGAARAAE
jgi:hypothetical protein